MDGTFTVYDPPPLRSTAEEKERNTSRHVLLYHKFHSEWEIYNIIVAGGRGTVQICSEYVRINAAEVFQKRYLGVVELGKSSASIGQQEITAEDGHLIPKLHVLQRAV